MARFGSLSVVIFLILSGRNPLWADGTGDMKALVERAIRASGGTEKVARLGTVNWKLKGTVHANGNQVPFSSEMTMQSWDQSRTQLDLEGDGRTVQILFVVNGNKGWIKAQDKAQDAPVKLLALRNEAFYITRMPELLIPLQRADCQLEPVGEIEVGKRPAIGVSVARKGHGTVNVFFDKETGLLVQSGAPLKGLDDKEHSLEYRFEDYQEIEGLKHFTKVKLNVDGELFLEGELTEITFSERLDDSTFGKP